MSQSTADFDNQLEKLLEKEKNARINNEHFTSVLILKDIVQLISIRSRSATTRRNGPSSTIRSTSS